MSYAMKPEERNETYIRGKVAMMFNPCNNIVIPLFCYGFHAHECDLLVISKTGIVSQIEIKTSISDLNAETKKDYFKVAHYYNNNRSVGLFEGNKTLTACFDDYFECEEKIHKFYYAYPEDMHEKAVKIIPEKAGIILIKVAEKERFQNINTYFSDCTPAGSGYAEKFRSAKLNKNAQPPNEEDKARFLHFLCMGRWGIRT